MSVWSVVSTVPMIAFVVCVIQNARAGAAFSRYIRERNPPEFEPYKSPPPIHNSASTAVFLFSAAASQLAARDPAFAPVLASCRRGCLYLPLWFVSSVAFVFVARYFIFVFRW